MIDVDNTKPEDYMHDLEPDTSSYSDDNDLGILTPSKQEYDAYMANSDNFCEGEIDPNEPTPSQMNEELRRGGW